MHPVNSNHDETQKKIKKREKIRKSFHHSVYFDSAACVHEVARRAVVRNINKHKYNSFITERNALGAGAATKNPLVPTLPSKRNARQKDNSTAQRSGKSDKAEFYENEIMKIYKLQWARHALPARPTETMQSAKCCITIDN